MENYLATLTESQTESLIMILDVILAIMIIGSIILGIINIRKNIKRKREFFTNMKVGDEARVTLPGATTYIKGIIQEVGEKSTKVLVTIPNNELVPPIN